MIYLLQLFLTHLQGYKRQAVWSPILIVVEVICELLLPLVMAEIVDTAIPAGDETYIFQLGAVMLVLAGVAMLCGVLASRFAAFASQGFGGNLRQCLFDKVQQFSFADIDRFSSASLITRSTNDIQQIQMLFVMLLRIVFYAPIIGIGGIDSGEKALEYLYAGANAVEVGAAALFEPTAPLRVARELDELLDARPELADKLAKGETWR
mgnify:CR=1 FL=1